MRPAVWRGMLEKQGTVQRAITIIGRVKVGRNGELGTDELLLISLQLLRGLLARPIDLKTMSLVKTYMSYITASL